MSASGETWRLVPTKPQFMASSEGRFMVTPYYSKLPNGGFRSYGGSPRFGVWNKQDARFITVWKGKTYKIHQLVCEAFNGPKPFKGAVVMHLDENSANNRPENLVWGTQKENMAAPYLSGSIAMGPGKRKQALRDESLPRGVSHHKASGKYRAYSNEAGRQHHLGTHASIEAAEMAVAMFEGRRNQ